MNLLSQPLGSCPRHAENGKHRKRHLFKNRHFSLARQQKTLGNIVFLLSRQWKITVLKSDQFQCFSIPWIVVESIPDYGKNVSSGTHAKSFWGVPSPGSGHDEPACSELKGGFPECRGRCCRRPTLGFHKDPPRGVPPRGVRNDAEQIFIRCYFVILFITIEQITK